MRHTTRVVVLPGDVPAEVAWRGSHGGYGEKGGLRPPRDPRPSTRSDGAIGKERLSGPTDTPETRSALARTAATCLWEKTRTREADLASALGTLGKRGR